MKFEPPERDSNGCCEDDPAEVEARRAAGAPIYRCPKCGMERSWSRQW